MMECHYGSLHGKEPTKKMILKWLKDNTPFSGKGRLAQQCIDDLDLKFSFYRKWGETERHNITLIRILNSFLKDGTIKGEKKGRAYVYTLT